MELIHPGAWEPKIDIYRTPDGCAVKVELAGVNVKDIFLHCTQKSLVLEGTRNDGLYRERGSHYSMEIAYNRFCRVINFPSEIEGSEIISHYDKGMLLLHIKNEKR